VPKFHTQAHNTNRREHLGTKDIVAHVAVGVVRVADAAWRPVRHQDVDVRRDGGNLRPQRLPLQLVPRPVLRSARVWS
jgi:hypothetical protein